MNTITNSALVIVTVNNDSDALKWCLSELQMNRPMNSGSCVGGSGADNGWELIKPTTFNASR